MRTFKEWMALVGTKPVEELCLERKVQYGASNQDIREFYDYISTVLYMRVKAANNGESIG
jgi:hypothetical protein